MVSTASQPVALNGACLSMHEENAGICRLPRLPLDEFARFPCPTLEGVRRGLDEVEVVPGFWHGRRFGRWRGRGCGRSRGGWSRRGRWRGSGCRRSGQSRRRRSSWRGRTGRHGSGGRRSHRSRGGRRGRGLGGAAAGERQQRGQRQRRQARIPPHAASIAARAGGVGRKCQHLVVVEVFVRDPALRTLVRADVDPVAVRPGDGRIAAVDSRFRPLAGRTEQQARTC